MSLEVEAEMIGQRKMEADEETSVYIHFICAHNALVVVVKAAVVR